MVLTQAMHGIIQDMGIMVLLLMQHGIQLADMMEKVHMSLMELMIILTLVQQA